MAKPSTQAPSGVVSSVQGRAQVIRQGQETAEALQVGDTLMPGDRLVGSADASLQIAESAAPGAQVWNLAFNEAGTNKGKAAAKPAVNGEGGKSLDDVIGAIERGNEEDATAAGLTGGDGAAMGEGLRVDRVVEVVTPQSLSGASNGDGQDASIKSTTLLDDGNQAPVFIDGGAGNFDPSTGNYRFLTDEDVPVSGQVKASDADGDSLTFVKGSDPQHGTVVVNPDGSWTYTPNKDFNGPDVFTVTVSDGKGGTATSTVFIGVNPVNDPPKFDDPNNPNYDPVTGNYKATTEEDKPVSGTVKATDVDGDPLTFAKGSNPSHGTVTVDAQGNWTYTPNKDYNGSDSFTITVSDGKGGTATSTVSIGITPVNDPPKFDDPNNPNYDPVTGNYKATTEEDKPVSGTVKATDVDGDPLTFAKGSNPAHGTVTVDANGNWTYTPSKNYNGSDSFTITVSDGKGGTATSTVNIGVTPVNDPPKFDDPNNPNYDPVTGNYKATTEEDKPVSGTVKATDVDGDALTFAKGSNPAHGTVTVDASGNWTYTPNKDYNGSDSFTITVSDGKGGTATSTVSIGITPVNDPPKFDDPSNPNYDPVTGNYKATTEEDKPVSGTVKATDVDGDPLTFAKGSNPSHGTVTVDAQGNWTYTPNKDYNGSDSFTITVSDGKGGTATSTVSIGITPVNDPPKFDDPNNPNYDPVTGNYKATTEEDKPVSGTVKATDVDGDPLTFAKGSNPSHGTVTVDAQGNWTYTPNKDYNGSDSFTITVSDGKGGTATSTVSIGITPVNDPPKFDDPNNPNYDPVTGNYKATTEEDKPVSGTVKATDVDGDPLTFAKGSNPSHGTVTVDAQGNWTYTPNKNYNGSDSFTITVSDGKGGTAMSTVNIGITPVNDPPKFDDPNNPNYDPVTGNYKATTEEDKPVSGTVKATDVDGDPLTFAKGSNPSHGTVTVDANGNWTYTPNKDYNGSDSFTISVNDGKGGTTTSTVYIGITPVNDAPTVTVNGSATVSEEGLAGANADTQGSSDTTNAREASGHVTVSDVDSSSVSLTLSGPAGLTSGGVAITWSGNGTAASPLVGSAGGKVILTATIDNGGDYKVTLSGPLDHADATKEDTRTVNLTVNANDGQATTKATLPVIVEDDSPLSGAQNINVSSQIGSQNTNLMLIVDTSGSMKDRLADMTVNGLKAAIKTLIDRYDDLGDVKIQLVTFGDGAKGQSVWMTVDQAKTLINSLKGDGGTNYDGALAAARTAFATSGKISGGVNVSYFITDGQPTKGYALDSKDEASWETFLGNNKIDSYAIGTGTLNSTNVAAIEPVAYNGITGTEKAAVTLGTNTELGNYLLDTVPVIQKGTLSGLAGADGLQRIESFTASGQLGSSLDSSGKVLTIQLKSGGTMQVNMETGEFTLSQPHNATTNETFSYTLVDKDGDRGTGTVSLTAQNTSPEGTDATITLLEDGKHTFSASNFGFHDADAGDKLQAVRIDALPAHGTLTLNGTAVVAGQVIGASQLDKLVFTPVANANGTGYAQISFSVQDSHGAFDVSANTLKFNVTPVNDAPDAMASTSGHNLLGLIDLTVNPLLNLSKTQQVAVNDVDNNLVRVEVQVDTLLSLGSLLGDRSSLSISHDAALSVGLQITGNDSRHIVIESIHAGGTVDITQVNKLLATLTYDPADILGLSVDLFPSLKITATDSFGAHDTACVSSSIVAIGVDVAPVITTVETVVHVAGEHAAQLGTEVFQWHLADHPATGGCVDTIHGFDGAARNVGGDVLDLRDLLSGSADIAASGQVEMDKLLAHLDFDTQSQPGSTVIHVSASGGFQADASGNSLSSGCGDQQHIVLANVDIRASLGLDAQASDHQIIAELMQRGKLLVDQA